jgi:hypothetical protein
MDIKCVAMSVRILGGRPCEQSVTDAHSFWSKNLPASKEKGKNLQTLTLYNTYFTIHFCFRKIVVTYAKYCAKTLC